MANWLDDRKNRRSLLVRNLCQSNGFSCRISLWDDLAEDKWRPYFYNCICQWAAAFFTAGSNQSNWSSLYRCLVEETAKSISSNELNKKAAWKKTQHPVSSTLPYFNLNRSLFCQIYFFTDPINNYPTDNH